MAVDVVFDGFSFADNGCVITSIDQYTLAKRTNQVEQRANRNFAVFVQSLLGTKPINVKGYFDGANSTAAQNMYDLLAQALNRAERTLLLPHAGGTRRFTATPESVILSNPRGLNRLEFDFDFVVAEGSSFNLTATTLINTSTTAASTTIPLTVNGSVSARPLITLTFNTVTGGTAKTVSIRNGRDYVGLTITRTFSSGDTITIDSDKFQIYINGVLTAPSGRFPTWEPGIGSLYYSDTFSTRSVGITATYTERNL